MKRGARRRRGGSRPRHAAATRRRLAGRRRALHRHARAVSLRLPGHHRVDVVEVSARTGSTRRLVSTAARRDGRDPIAVASEHLARIGPALGFGKDEKPEFVPDPRVQYTSTGDSAVHFRQHYRGVPVFEMAQTVRLTREGVIEDVVGDGMSIPEVDTAPLASPVQAARTALDHVARLVERARLSAPLDPAQLRAHDPSVVGSFALAARPTVLDAGPLPEPICAQLVLVPMEAGVRLGWHVRLALPGPEGAIVVIVAADDRRARKVLAVRDGARHAVGEAVVVDLNPFLGPPQPRQFPHPAFPGRHPQMGDWIFANATSGNNVASFVEDPVTGRRAPVRGQPGPAGVLAFAPANPLEHAAINAFYFCNAAHDFFLRLGFDEPAGNFQVRNLTPAGRPGDPVTTISLAGPFPARASIRVLEDGRGATMYLGADPVTGRHAAFDADIVLHEYAHGVTGRLVGGLMNLDSLNHPQSLGMGEGWSDFFALTLANFVRPAGVPERTVVGDWTTPGGLRTKPYDAAYPGTFGSLGSGPYRDRYTIGEVWCATLMEMTRQLEARLAGGRGVYWLAWQIVVDGLKRTPPNPTFLHGRDAIAMALEARGPQLPSPSAWAQARRALWDAFARFGMGARASCLDAGLNGIAEDFSLPPGLP